MLNNEQKEELEALLAKTECDFILDNIKNNEIDSFARFIRLRRIERCVSMRELAKETGLSNTTISRYESGIKKNPNVTALIKLGKALDFTLNDIEKYF